MTINIKEIILTESILGTIGRSIVKGKQFIRGKKTSKDILPPKKINLDLAHDTKNSDKQIIKTLVNDTRPKREG